MNNTVAVEIERKPAYAIVFGCIMAIGLPLNAVSLWTLLRHHRLKSSTAVFMVNLAMSDLLLVISLPMRVYFYATGTWPLSAAACWSVTMLFRNNIRSSSIFITFISVDRLLAVVYPLRSRHLRTLSHAWKAVALVWLFVLVVNIPEIVVFSKNLSTNGSYCFELRHDLGTLSSAMVYFQLVLVLILLAVIVVCTVMVSWTLHRHLNDSARVNNKVNAMLIFVMNLVMFTICFLPASVGLLKVKKFDLTPFICLATLNCCLDPLLYYFSLDAFWKKKEDADIAREH
ncbi:lysophosphatidic acid receptor 5-like [Micropterus dolomieu]|uniref:lysophosphatidic acid receptor 5b n=1 Tax=Micropterus dolomieu TaxID=147949 RepID=UPI001E8E1DFD|nr:lysophosphatidic acid receptor 5b [Micropterus dolomieu]XP_045930669.1 lysophosphatidic acid receptor 5-like [Micropterus dolomieu]